ncbi:unnamed protein product [Acanthocheilonema viteae]|uniref:non-specific serine/threonine protein kinase n=1 Tax=Acanthocheilonema viteae TaxID=6277 RepID=A0A498SQ89_ACAVI|nr:unnamed protein product [Acanthocheilonema viteae]
MSLRRRARKVEISMPTNFEHRYHAGFNPVTGQYHGLPKQWQAIIGITPNRRGRPRPMVDPSCITPTEIAEIKTVVRGDVPQPYRNGVPVSNKLRNDHIEMQGGVQDDFTRMVRISEPWTRFPQSSSSTSFFGMQPKRHVQQHSSLKFQKLSPEEMNLPRTSTYQNSKDLQQKL